MIISTNSVPSEETFLDLLENSVNQLKNCARDPNFLQGITAIKFENRVYESMVSASSGTEFEGSIRLVSGHRFPDIVAHNYYGVEVKTTVQDHWSTLGNSVLESTRVEGIERIYLMFGKISEPFHCRFRKYQECVAEVVVTHSPRYRIDMNLPPGESIFDKMEMTYDDIRRLQNPIAAFMNYYRQQFGEDTDTWWLSNGAEATTPVTITFWSDLPCDKRNEIIGYCFLFNPEIFGSSTKKYQKMAAWLVKKHSLISTNIRDAFSAGGKMPYSICGQEIMIPRIYYNLLQRKDDLKNAFNNLTADDYNEIASNWNITWNSPQPSLSEVYEAWKEQFLAYVRNNQQDGLDPSIKESVISDVLCILKQTILPSD